MRNKKRDQHRRLATDIELFIKQYGRKRSAGIDPNDRSYSRRVEELVKRMDPVELDLLIRGDYEDETLGQ